MSESSDASWRANEDSSSAAVATFRKAPEVVVGDAACVVSSAKLSAQGHFAPQGFRSIRAARRARQVLVVPVDRLRLGTTSDLFRPAQQEHGVGRARGARKAPKLGQESRAREIGTTPVASGVGEREQIGARREL